LENRD